MTKGTTLLTGNRQGRSSTTGYRGAAGFTFFEVMVALVILSTGIVVIYRALLFSLTVESHLRNRLHALALLDDRLARIEKLYNDDRRHSPRLRHEQMVEQVGSKEIAFQLALTVNKGEPLKNMETVDVQLAWPEQDHFYILTRRLFFYRPVDKAMPPET